VHISNIHARDELHRHSITSSASTAVICGLGSYGYLAAMLAVVQRLGKLPEQVPASLHGLKV
jgi:3-dehydroquinate dehydratase-2